ncbi:glycoside hydrolase family 97 protein [Parabacteroides timonensis]|uniref:glycoside hydrolase family 97 protein n=1 Tax=Parabacteroides timonensis TaxID=1871013 RepID=UPI00094ECD0A|nr:glycoside hydrolase family 97 protein [Parabacteroides timonensis]
MKKLLISLSVLLAVSPLFAQERTVSGPDNNLKVTVSLKRGGEPVYQVTYKDKTVIEESPLGVLTDIGDFSKRMKLVEHKTGNVDEQYTLNRCKTADVHYVANKLVCTFENADQKKMDVIFQVSNNDIAFRYAFPQYGHTACLVIEKEATGFDFPQQTTTFMCPQAAPMTGWERTKPSYEEEYTPDEPVGMISKHKVGHTFPCLFHIDNNWVLVSETGVSSRYCASHLSDGSKEGLYTIAFPHPGENNGNGSAAPGLALPGETPWRTITVGDNLQPIVETTIPFDVVKPLYDASQDYKFGRSTWSWIVWQDGSINYDDQIKYIDLASAMGYEYVLIDNWWDTKIGHERMAELIKYAKSKNVGIFLWYNSNGYWSDAPQGPKQRMCTSPARKKEMKWLQEQGVKGLKVDFFGGDKQETMQLYEDILTDANEHGLMIIFHGCTLPRGWERMYPNYVGSEAVLASENLIFDQYWADRESYNACLHPFIRNAVGSMDFGGTLLNKRYNRTNDGGTIRKTTDIFQLATAVLFQSPVQNFALTPNNLTDVPSFEIDFMKQIPTTWDETRFIDGYPGKYCVLARRHADKWYITGINAGKETLKLKVSLPMLAGQKVTKYDDNKDRSPRMSDATVKQNGEYQLEILPDGGIVLVN